MTIATTLVMFFGGGLLGFSVRDLAATWSICRTASRRTAALDALRTEVRLLTARNEILRETVFDQLPESWKSGL
jgi:hypothetical protein